MGNINAISFWNFLSKFSIEIPIIQRDYAQGRKDKTELRKGFLSNLKDALKSGNVLKLDFVYGAETNGIIKPLDGQQRLTTLWLLHWYIALRANKLSSVCEKLKKFTYETRVSSREFCDQLCTPTNYSQFDGKDIVGFIANQTWFYSVWKQDPTIQSMLRMLSGTKELDKHDCNFVDGIEKLFSNTDDFSEYWNKLTGENCPIVFYHLSLKDFGFSDQLYIKMNARGKQLTSFENFKADFIGYINKQDGEEWKKLLNPTDGLPIKLDTIWTEIFWKKRSSDNEIDNIYFAFINRFFWNELFIAKNEDDKYILDIGKGDENSTQENNNPFYKYLNEDINIKYEGLEKYKFFNGEIPLQLFKKLNRVLSNYSKINSNSMSKCDWDDNFRFIPEYNGKEKGMVIPINQVQRIVFFALCKYFDEQDDKQKQYTEQSLKQWMRVVWNLVSGEDKNGKSEIRSTSAMRTAISFIDSLDSHNVYISLSNINERDLTDSVFDERCKEEIVKVKKIIEDSSWEGKIIEAEKYAFFKGSIRFLFTGTSGNVNWDDFDIKWVKIKSIIPQKQNEIIKSMIPYLYDDSIKEIFSNCHLSYEDKNLKFLFQKYPSKINNFLKGESRIQNLSALHKDLLLLCEQGKDYLSYWLHEKWVDGNDVLSNYSNRSGAYEEHSFFVGNEYIKQRLNVLEKVEGLEFNMTSIGDEQYCIYKGLFINFKYSYEDKEYYFRWKTGDVFMYDNDWKRNIENSKDGKFHFQYNDSVSLEDLQQQLNNCCKEYEELNNQLKDEFE